MSKDIYRASTQTVESKYFTSESVMDESLSDFKEPKKLGTVKPTKKTKPGKPKKAPKRTRGQKDIRSVLCSKKNDLESYTKDFETVCQHAGLDVDSEQLQLAIALSKSLQPPTSTSTSDLEISQPLSTQDRVGKIRTTLLEYGFKVPEIKITTSKRLKRRKKYKLLLTSEETKKQGITDKYSQVLFQSVSDPKYRENTNLDVTSIHLYHLTTSASYKILKSIDTFYVDGLLEKSASTCNMLRNWSEIPGRPMSPKVCESSTMNFSEIECSQEELDIVLSGSLKSCRNIINNKEKEAALNKNDDQRQIFNTNNLNNIFLLIEDKTKNNYPEIVHKNDKTSQIDDDQIRSCSPDLFDDEPSTIDEPGPVFLQDIEVPKSCNDILDLTECDQKYKSKESNLTSSKIISQNVTKRLNDSMEFTSCVDVQYLGTNTNKTTFQLSQNITKIKSNDCMEITNSVSSPVKPLPKETDIDLTQSPENQNDSANLIKPVNNVNQSPIIDIDLANKNKEKSIKLLKATTALNENDIDLTESLEVLNKIADRSVESLDLTQSSNTSDELPFVSLKTNIRNSQEIVSESADNTIIIDPKDYEGISKPILKDNNQSHRSPTKHSESNNDTGTVHKLLHSSQENRNHEIDLTLNFQTSEVILDLTQDVVMLSRQNSEKSSFEEFDHNHSSNSDLHEVCTSDSAKIMNITECIIQNHINPTDKGDNNDLTENSGPSEELSQNLRAQYNKTSELELVMDVSLEESDIDLTQNTSTSEDLSQDLPNKDSSSCPSVINIQNENDSNNDSDSTVEMVIKCSQRCSSLGKKDDVSIDYDDLYDRNNHFQSQHTTSISKSLTENEPNTRRAETEHNLSNVFNKSKDLSNCSQDSEVFVISDNELDYSMHQSKLEKPVNNFELGGISIIHNCSGIYSVSNYRNIDNPTASGVNSSNAADDIIEVEKYNPNITPAKCARLNKLSTPQKASCGGINTIVTPSNHEYIIKTHIVTPKPNYEVMSMEEIHKELDDFGIKPLKRKRAIQLLTHIYNQTHPTIDEHSDESPYKKRKTNDYESPQKSSPKKVTPRMIMSPKKHATSPRKVGKKSKDTSRDSTITTNERLNNKEAEGVSKNYEVVKTPVIKEIECSPTDWVFQKREKAKVHSCRVPLHIAFHNYVSSRRGLREAILCYEPINIDDIHKDLVAYGHRYDPKELLKFMDKKCITVKTTDNDGRNQKR